MGNSIRGMGYAPTTEKKHFKKEKKIQTKISHVRLDKFREKLIFFVSSVRKTKNVSCNTYFSNKICLFTHNTKYIIFS
jgi:hypothetical protein